MLERRTARARNYSTGNIQVDSQIDELIAEYGEVANADLLKQMITTCFRLVRDEADRGEMKLVNSALKEFAY